MPSPAIGVIGVFPKTQGSGEVTPPGTPLGPTFRADAFLTALARLTGMTDSAGVALVFGVGDAGTDLVVAVNESIAALSRPIAVHLATVGALPTGLQVGLATDVVPSVRPGEQACFDVALAGSGQPQGSFTLEFPASASFLRRQAEEPKNATLLADALYAVTGRRLTLAFAVGPERERPDDEPDRPASEEEIVELMKSTFDARELER